MGALFLNSLLCRHHGHLLIFIHAHQQLFCRRLYFCLASIVTGPSGALARTIDRVDLRALALKQGLRALQAWRHHYHNVGLALRIFYIIQVFSTANFDIGRAMEIVIPTPMLQQLDLIIAI